MKNTTYKILKTRYMSKYLFYVETYISKISLEKVQNRENYAYEMMLYMSTYNSKIAKTL